MTDISAVGKAREQARLALVTLSNAIDDELTNLGRFEDDRMLVATADLKRHYEAAIEAADLLQDEYESWKYSGEAA